MTHIKTQASSSAEIGAKIKNLRLQRGIGLGELARLAGIGKATLSSLESGNGNPRLETLDAISVALRLPLGDLITPDISEQEVIVRATPDPEVFSQELLFRLPRGLSTEIWHLRMRHNEVIKSPAHAAGTTEHIFVFSGALEINYNNKEIVMGPGDFVRIVTDVQHSYTAIGDVDGLVLMAYSL
ncbi:XRE family transcriptional regulator [Halomonas sp. McH1-25]|uniref:helix-turn-helix domain-containing protein n=1 Tax=unclassified Halomonas TaxID=2609666 RepID=UPI001EF41B34|nr:MULTISPECIES: XRE family transcriptional regulator [unclassified Halomonas]MCG7601506.1 XRE family transcriptional regulator [Halomonas sp. McH1-25]MCP1343943.1 XRE family transcriptional regulator [Halomonas sp. FL8]MCP1361522.1 XRE family transcriptional regulator [Halomonas sp. BBD45]MCP1363769.1 XRE family transcriptional regulator [Halomonas sp. BBD48]